MGGPGSFEESFCVCISIDAAWAVSLVDLFCPCFDDDEETVDDEEEVFEIDERYVVRNSLPPPASVDAEPVTAGENVDVIEADADDTRRKFYSYYTLEEVRELVTKSGWTILEINEEDHRGVSDYVDHSKVYVFATRSNE